jgi:hypothetical protein
MINLKTDKVFIANPRWHRLINQVKFLMYIV